MSGPGRPGATPTDESTVNVREIERMTVALLTQYKRTADDMRETCKKAEEERSELAVKLHSEKENAENLSITLNERTAEVDTLTREKNDALSQLETVSEEAQHLRNALAQRNQEYENLKAKNQKLEAKLEESR